MVRYPHSGLLTHLQKRIDTHYFDIYSPFPPDFALFINFSYLAQNLYINQITMTVLQETHF